MKHLPINIGYYNVKSIDNQIFKTRVGKTFSDLQSSVDILQYNGTKYMIGEGDISLDLDKTSKEIAKLCILNMLSRFTIQEETFKLILTSPPLSYALQKNELPVYLIGKYDVVHNKKNKRIIIEDVKVYPETVTAFIANNLDGRYNHRKVMVIDIGGLTTNGFLLTNGNFGKDDYFSFPNGMYHVNQKICDHINQHYYQNLNIDDLDYARQNGLYLKGSNTDIMIKEIERIHDIYCEFIEKIIQQCELKKWSVDAYDILITGGGGKILFNTIKDNYMPNAKLSNNPIFDNLNGLAIVTKRVYG